MYYVVQSLLLICSLVNTVLFSKSVAMAFKSPTFGELQAMFLLVYFIPMVLCFTAFIINKKATLRRRMTILVTDVSKMARDIRNEREKEAM